MGFHTVATALLLLLVHLSIAVGTGEEPEDPLPFPFAWLHPPKTGSSFGAVRSKPLLPSAPPSDSLTHVQGSVTPQTVC